MGLSLWQIDRLVRMSNESSQCFSEYFGRRWNTLVNEWWRYKMVMSCMVCDIMSNRYMVWELDTFRNNVVIRNRRKGMTYRIIYKQVNVGHRINWYRVFPTKQNLTRTQNKCSTWDNIYANIQRSFIIIILLNGFWLYGIHLWISTRV